MNTLISRTWFWTMLIESHVIYLNKQLNMHHYGLKLAHLGVQYCNLVSVLLA